MSEILLTETEAERLGDAYDVGPATVLKVVTRIVAAREATARREACDEVFQRINADRSAEIERLGGVDKVRASTALNNWVDGIGVGARHASDVHDNRPARADHRPHEIWASDARDAKASEVEEFARRRTEREG